MTAELVPSAMVKRQPALGQSTAMLGGRQLGLPRKVALFQSAAQLVRSSRFQLSVKGVVLCIDKHSVPLASQDSTGLQIDIKDRHCTVQLT